MSKHDLFRPFSAVPVIGAPCEAFEAVVMVTVRCKCRPENTPFVLTGVGTARACVHCRTAYTIVKAEYDREKGMTAVSAGIGVVGRVADTEPAPEVVLQ